MSPDSLRRLTEGWGQVIATRRAQEAAQASAPAGVGESPRTRRVGEMEPIARQASVSTDGAMVLIRTEGWKEVKVVAVSEVSAHAAGEHSVGWDLRDGQGRRLENGVYLVRTENGGIAETRRVVVLR